MVYESASSHLLAGVWLTFERAKMQMISWMCGESMKDGKTSEELNKK